MKIYFGRQPSCNFTYLDKVFEPILIQENYQFEKAVERLLTVLLPDDVYWTINPLIPNYMDDGVATKLIWMIDPDGNEVHAETDPSLLKKLKFMGAGEALCDDSRCFY